MTISRRAFVMASGTALLSRRLLDRPRPPSTALARPTLVVLFLRGGVDGLSMVVPHGDPQYYAARSHIAVPARDVVDLDGYFGLHPSLAPLKPLWDNKSLAVVHAAGTPGTTRSHVEDQARLEGGSWLTRSCYLREPLARALAQIARLIKANVGIEIAFAAATGWDTHLYQGASTGRLATGLNQLGLALAAFAHDLGERMRDVVVLTLSEFGRTIRENGTLGTDHGLGTAMLVLGGPVLGGQVLGRWPGLDSSDERPGLAATTDVRDLCAEVLARHLRAAHPTPVFPGFTPHPARFPGAIRA
jgi:uncharacterized protein (DUF1501 family)